MNELIYFIIKYIKELSDELAFEWNYIMYSKYLICINKLLNKFINFLIIKLQKKT